MARVRQKRQPKQSQLALLSGHTALYIRVSTDRQVAEGFSLDAQVGRLRAFCDAHEWLIDDEHIYVDEGITGKNTTRPAFQRMMLAAEQRAVQRIVAVKLDRLARNTRDFLATVDRLRRYECDLVLLAESFDTSTPHGKFALTMFAAIAELEASQITERVMSGKRQKARGGGYNGGPPPLGYAYDGEAWALTGQADSVRRIFELFVVDGYSLSAIAQILNEEGVATQRGGRWYPATVRYILNNGFYAGLVQYEEIEELGEHPAIVTSGWYELATQRLRALRPGPQR